MQYSIQGFAASGNAKCRYHRANAQDLPHRLATSIIQHFGVYPRRGMQPHGSPTPDYHRLRGTLVPVLRSGATAPDFRSGARIRRRQMNSVIYLVGLIVVVLLILSFFGLR
jgi:hypothetical protein